jgi:hypothetical protein
MVKADNRDTSVQDDAAARTQAACSSQYQARAEEAQESYAAREPMPVWPESERERLEALNRQIAAGYQRAALCRPPSWCSAEPRHPTPGAICARCTGRLWWSRDKRHWRCSTCHPAPNLARADVTEVCT